MHRKGMDASGSTDSANRIHGQANTTSYTSAFVCLHSG
ncbi:hypothetical protein SynA1528_00621 [Synechococcus sp. A15-28]|nr:hypothetical protein SynA1528_00621 [Synechococcus sp. A15-28]